MTRSEFVAEYLTNEGLTAEQFKAQFIVLKDANGDYAAVTRGEQLQFVLDRREAKFAA